LVKVKDLGDIDIYLPNKKIIYVPESQLVIASRVDASQFKMSKPYLVIADRNAVTVDAYSKVIQNNNLRDTQLTRYIGSVLAKSEFNIRNSNNKGINVMSSR